MGSPNVPTGGNISGTTTVVTLTFSTIMGAVYLINSGANTVWVTYDGTNPVASDGTGRVGITAGAALNLDDIMVDTIKAISTAAFTLQYCALQRPGSNSAGF